jgi:hypothetical protein
VRCLHDLLLLLGDVLGSLGSKDGSYPTTPPLLNSILPFASPPPPPPRRSLRHCIAHSPLPHAINILLTTLLTLNPPVRARQQAQAEAAGEIDAAPVAAAADAAAAAAGGRVLACLRRSVLAVRSRALKPEDRFII